jgi:aerobic C4-dicarboxylate transport protein
MTTKLFKSLTFQVLVAIASGIAVGVLFPQQAASLKFVGDIFINLIKMVIPPIVFLTVVAGICSMGDMKKLGKVGGKALLYFEVVTTFALFIGLVVGNLVKPGAGMALPNLAQTDISQYTKGAKEMDWLAFFLHIIPSNIVKAFADGDVLQVLFVAVLFGVALTQLGETTQSIVSFFDKLAKVFFKILALFMRLAPLGAFGGMAYTIGKFGLAALVPMLKLLATVYITLFLFVFVVLNLIAWYSGFSLWRFLGYIKDEILIVLGTASSETVLPRMMDKLEKYGCEKSVVSLVIPTGYAFNLDGSTIYLSMAVVFLAQVYQIPLTWQQELTILGVLVITSKGAAAVTGSALLVLASTLSALNIIPIEGVALLLGTDRFMSEARAITNLIGNGVATLVIAKSENAYHPQLLSKIPQEK